MKNILTKNVAKKIVKMRNFTRNGKLMYKKMWKYN